MKSWIFIVSVISSMLFGVIIHQQEPPQAGTQIRIESKTVGVGEKTALKLTVSGAPLPGVASIQGKLTFDPGVLKVNDVTFASNFSVKAKNILSGEVRFAATITQDGTPITEGMLVEFAVEAIGPAGVTTPLRVTIDILSDLGFQPIAHQIVPGTFSISTNKNPIADFTFSPANPTNMELVRFSDASSDPDGQVVGWSWDFGDGGTSTERNPFHRYRTPGTYTVTLTVTDDKGSQGAKSAQITIAEGPVIVVTQTFPNPGRTHIIIEYFLPSNAKSGALRMFNIKGELVLAKELDVTADSFRWDLTDNVGNPLPNGPYLYVITAVLQDGRTIRSTTQTAIIQR